MSKKLRAFSTNVEDYPENMSLYEKESLAAEAVLARRNAKKKLAKKKPARTSSGLAVYRSDHRLGGDMHQTEFVRAVFRDLLQLRDGIFVAHNGLFPN